MELKLDFDKFDERQAILMEEITRAIVVKLREAGLEGQKMEEITAAIAFSIASIIDDTTHMEADGVEVKPYLTFRGEGDELIHLGENSYTYEYVLRTLKKLFDV